MAVAVVVEKATRAEARVAFDKVSIGSINQKAYVPLRYH
jgi:hypothetical protein